MKAAEWEKQSREEAPPTAQEGPAGQFQPVDWEKLLNGPIKPPEWLLWPIVERGQLASLYSAPKQGKSLLALEMAAAAAAGNPYFGRRAHDPVDVLYLDQENTETDLRERLTDMGYSPRDLQRLTYLSFPPVPPLDTPNGGKQVMELAARFMPDLMVFDTLSKFIEGDENEAKTWNRFYRHTALPLRRNHVAALWIDHTGKDTAKGARGSIAKAADVDAAFSLTYEPRKGTRTLKREHSRNGHAPEKVVLTVHTDPLRHAAMTATGQVQHASTERLIAELDRLGVPNDTGSPTAGKELRRKGIQCSSEYLRDAVAHRKKRLEEGGRDTPKTDTPRPPLSATPCT